MKNPKIWLNSFISTSQHLQSKFYNFSTFERFFSGISFFSSGFV
jgi:hypothetical protein